MSTIFFHMVQLKKLIMSVTERKQINKEKLSLSEEYMRAVFFLKLFCRFEFFFFKIKF